MLRIAWGHKMAYCSDGISTRSVSLRHLNGPIAAAADCGDRLHRIFTALRPGRVVALH